MLASTRMGAGLSAPTVAGFSPAPATTGILRNISNQFVFRQWTSGSYFYKQALGRLGVPGQVVTHRSVTDQRGLSSGTGEHAGHMIAIMFGPPGDLRNLGLQNANMNTYAPRALHEAFRGPGGNYLKLELAWKDLLLDGYQVSVTVTDKYKAEAERPFTRHVRWQEIAPSGRQESYSVDYANWNSLQRDAVMERQ